MTVVNELMYQGYTGLFKVRKFDGDMSALKKLEERPIFVNGSIVQEQEQKSKRIFRLAGSLNPSQYSLYYVEAREYELEPESEPIFMLIYFGPIDQSGNTGVIRVYDKPISENEKNFIVRKIAELSGLSLNFSPSPTESQGSVNLGKRKINVVNLTGNSSNNEINLTGNNSNIESSPIIITKKQKTQPKERPYFIEPSMNLKKLLKNKFYYTNINFNKRNYYISSVYNSNVNKHYVDSVLSGEGYRSMRNMYTRNGKQNELNTLEKSWKSINDPVFKGELEIMQPNGIIRKTTWSDEIHNFLANYKRNPNKYKSEGKSIDL